MSNYLWTDTEWTWPLLKRVYEEIARIGDEELGLNPYPNSFDIINSEQMLDAYASIGMPVLYKHWSFGKHFTHDKKSYDYGRQGLAYELVINSNPCINYLMEDNTMTMMALVMSHAGIGHSHFFRNNATFLQWTDADSIIDYLVFARDYIARCEEHEGRPEVEHFLDSCHTIMNYGVNRSKRPNKLSTSREKERQRTRQEFAQSRVNELFDRLLQRPVKDKVEVFPKSPEENILYFCEKYAPDLPIWKREIIRIVRKISQYFYPQRMTQVMNEGCATYTHYRIMNRLHELEHMTDGSMMEFLQSHTNVVLQPEFDDRRYSGLNPYALGFAMMRDIARICHEPTEEDSRWFPLFAGCKDEMSVLKDAWANYRDESFVRQFLSPKVVRDFKFFRVKDNRKEEFLEVTAIQNERGFETLRESLADHYETYNRQPNIEVQQVEPKSRTLKLVYHPYRGRRLQSDDAQAVMRHVRVLWGDNPVVLHDNNGNTLVS